MFTRALSFPAGLALALFSMGPATAQTSASGVDCTNSEILEACPGQCAAACEDLTFFRENARLCAAALDARGEDDPALCGAAVSAEPVTLSSCLTRASAIAVEDSPLPDLREIYTAFYSDIPACALSPVALTEMYSCLDDEARIITSEFGSIQRIEVDSNDPAAMLGAACRLKQSGTIVELHGAAKSLRSRAEALTGHLGGVSECRRSYADWLGTRGEICSNSQTTFDGCEIAINALNLSIDQRLQSAKGQNDRIANVLGALREDLATIMALTIIAGGVPAGDDCQ